VLFLFENGADVTYHNKDGETPVHKAILNKNPGYALEIVQFLVKCGASVNDCAMFNSTPLRLACHNGHLELAVFLLEMGADPNHDSVLRAAATSNSMEIVKLLVEKYGVDVNKANKYGKLPVESAITENGDKGFDMVEYFIKKCGISANAADNFGFHLMHFAYISNAPKIVEFLISMGASLNCPNEYGNIPHTLKYISKDMSKLVMPHVKTTEDGYFVIEKCEFCVSRAANEE
jgi:ankyrin repeat protein